MKVVIAGAVVVIVTAVVFFGWDKIQTWASVGSETLAEKIDEALGGYKVKRAEAQKALEKLEASIGKLREGQLRAEVKTEQIVEEQGRIGTKERNVKEALAKHRELLSSTTTTAVLGGKTYTRVQLQTAATRLIDAWNSLQTRSTALEKAHEILVKSSASLQSRIDKRQAQVAELKSRLEEIDAKILALDTMRGASEAAGVDNDSLAAKFGEVDKTIRELYEQVEVDLRVEEENWNDLTAGTDDIEEILRRAEPPEETVDKIDAILDS